MLTKKSGVKVAAFCRVKLCARVNKIKQCTITNREAINKLERASEREREKLVKFCICIWALVSNQRQRQLVSAAAAAAAAACVACLLYYLYSYLYIYYGSWKSLGRNESSRWPHAAENAKKWQKKPKLDIKKFHL